MANESPTLSVLLTLVGFATSPSGAKNAEALSALSLAFPSNVTSV